MTTAHIAGPRTNGPQTCTRCGVVLIDSPILNYREGARVVVEDGPERRTYVNDAADVALCEVA